MVKIDPVKDEVRDTYYPTNGLDPILDVSFRNDSIFALTSNKMYRGYIKSPSLADPSQWKIDSRLPIISGVDIYNDLEMIDDQLFVLYNSQIYGGDSVYQIKNTGIVLVTDPAVHN